MRKLAFLLFVCVIAALGTNAHAQDIDFAFGVGGIKSTSAANATGNHAAQDIGGGAFPDVSGDFLIKHNFGIEGDVAWRWGQNLYQGFQPFRPILYDFNAIYAPSLGKKVGVELMAGIGAVDTRFYAPTIVNCSSFSGCTNFISSNHFMGDVGGGLRLYVSGGLFVRPEARVYFIRNNNEFSSAVAERIGVSIGYSFGSRSF